VPNEAVFQPNQYAGQGRHFIYLLNAEQILQLVEVTLIKLDEDGAIIKPLQSMNLAAQKVVAVGSHFLQHGQKVTIWHREKGL
jgi:hypothetical protein